MANLSGINFLPSAGAFSSPGFDYSADLSAIERKKALAQALTQEGMEPIQNQMSGGWAVPISPFQGLSKLANSYVGGMISKKSIQDQRDLSTKAQGDYQKILAQGLAQMKSGDYEGAMGTLMSHPQTAQMAQMPMGRLQNNMNLEMMAKLLRGDGVPGAPGMQGPQPGEGTVLAPGQQGMPQGGMPQGQALPPGSQNILYGSTLGLPGLAKIGENQFEASKANRYSTHSGLVIDNWTGSIVGSAPHVPEGGMARVEGGKVTGVDPLPGASNVGPAYAGDRERAIQQNTIRNVQTQDRGEVPMWGNSIPYGGQAPAAPPASPGSIGPKAPIPQPPMNAGPRPPVVGGPQPQPSIQPQPLAPQGPQTFKQPIADPWQSMPKFKQPSGIGTGSVLSKGMQENQVKARGTLATDYGTAADQASQRMAFNNQALDLVDKADIGPGSDFMTKAKSFMVERLHIPESDFENNPAANIALNKDLTQSAIQQGKAMFGSRFTQSEVGIMLTKAAPSATQTRTAMKFLLQTDNARSQYEVQRANDFSKFVQQGGDATQFKAWYDKTFPMTNYTSSVELSANPKHGKGSVIKWEDLK